MGFRIEVEGGQATERLIKRLQTSPTKIFPTPFAGYLLFLFTGREKDIIKQFREDLVDLDSLTGSTIAFALFVEKFSVIVTEAPRSPHARRRDHLPATREFDAQHINGSTSIQHLVKSGKVGWILKGDELLAVTYATNTICKRLGILSEIPCIVVLDGMPSNKFQVIPLTNEIAASLVYILRQSIDKLRRTPGFVAYNNYLDKLHNLERLLPEIDERHKEIEHRRTIEERDIAHLNSNTWRDDFRIFLKKPNNLRDIVKFLDSKLPNSFASDHSRKTFLEILATDYGKSLHSLHECYLAISTLSDFERCAWPLEPGARKALDAFYSGRTTKRLLRYIATPVPSSLELLKELKQVLEAKSLSLEQNIFPSMGSQILARHNCTAQVSLEERGLELAALKLAREAAQEAIKEIPTLITSLSGLDVSFSKIFCDEVVKQHRRVKIKHSTNGIYHFLRPWLRPQTLLYLARQAAPHL